MILKSKIIKDFFSVLSGKFGVVIVNLLVTPVIARTLSKEEIGVFAIIFLIQGYASIFVISGMNDYVIREKNLSQNERNDVYSMTFTLGFIVLVIVSLLILPVCSWIGISEYRHLFFISVLMFPMVGLVQIAQAEIRKEQQFDLLLKLGVSFSVIRAIIVLATLKMGGGLMGYVLATVAMSLIEFALIKPFINNFKLKPFSCFNETSKKIWKYSRGLVGFSSINYWARKIDELLIGVLIGPVAVSIYNNAYKIMMIPMVHFNALIDFIMFPRMTEYSDDNKKIRSEFSVMLDVIGMCTVLPMLLIWIYRFEFISLYLGPGWDDVAALLGILIPIGILQTLVNPVGLTYKLKAQNDKFFKIGLLNTAVVVLGLIIGIRYGLEGVVIAYCCSNVLMLFPNIAVAMSNIDSSFITWLAVTGKYYALAGLVLLSSFYTHKVGQVCVGSLLFIAVGIYLLYFYYPLLRTTKPSSTV